MSPRSLALVLLGLLAFSCKAPAKPVEATHTAAEAPAVTHVPAHEEEAAVSDTKGAHGGRGRHFHDPKEWTKRWDSPTRKKWQRPDEVVALLGAVPGDTVADLGTGTGYFLAYLSAATGAGGRVIALDVEDAMVAHVKERVRRDALANVEVRKVPFDSPGLAQGEADRILIVNTWHHIDNRAAYAALLHDALDSCDRPGAVLIVEYTRKSRRGPPKKIRLDPETVMSELRAGGLEATLLEETLPNQYVVSGTRTDRPATCPQR